MYETFFFFLYHLFNTEWAVQCDTWKAFKAHSGWSLVVCLVNSYRCNDEFNPVIRFKCKLDKLFSPFWCVRVYVWLCMWWHVGSLSDASRCCRPTENPSHLWIWSPDWTTPSRFAAPTRTILHCGATGVNVTISTWTVRTIWWVVVWQ